MLWPIVAEDVLCAATEEWRDVFVDDVSQTLRCAQSDQPRHSFVPHGDKPLGVLRDKSDPRRSEPVLKRREEKNLETPVLVTVFIKEWS